MWFVGLKRERTVGVPFCLFGESEEVLKWKEKVSRRTTFIFEECCKKKKLASNALVGHLLMECTCWSPLSTDLSRVKKELCRESKMRSHMFGLARMSFLCLKWPQRKVAWTSLLLPWPTWLTSIRGDPVSNRIRSESPGKLVRRGQIRAFHLFQEEITYGPQKRR